MRSYTCTDCKKTLEHNGTRGRLPVRCWECQKYRFKPLLRPTRDISNITEEDANGNKRE